MKKSSAMDTLPPIGAACAVTAAAMYPVDVLRALKMASATGKGYTVTEFIKVHGVKGLLSQGVVPEVARATTMRVLKFFFFPISHTFLWGKPVSEGQWWQKAMAGALAVAPEVATVTTLELAKIGLQLDSESKYKNSTKLLVRDVRSKLGLRGCMVGWQGVQARQMLWTSTYFATLSTFRDYAGDVFGKERPAIPNFIGGFAAGALGALVNTPADVVRTTIQKEGLALMTQPGFNVNTYVFSFGKMFTVGSEIVAQRGIQGLYSGIGFKAMHMGGSGAFVAMLIPMFSKFMGVNRDIV